MAIFVSWKETILDWFEIFGPASLFFLSFTEAIIQPVPPDLMYLPMLINAAGSIPTIIWLWLVVTIASVLGSLVGYWLGQKWGRSLFEKFGQAHHISKLENLFEKYGTLGVFIAAFSPIPYKVFGWFAGMGEMEKKSFVIAGLFGRALRFGMEALIIGIYGQQAIDVIMWLLDNEILLGIALIGVFVCGFFAWRWWKELASDPQSS